MTDDPNKRLVELAQGMYVQADTLNIVEKIRNMYPTLDVQYLDPHRFPDLTDAPYKIVEKCPDGHVRTVFTTWSLDELVLERIYAADTRKHDVLGNLERANVRAELASKQRFRDRLAEQSDILIHALKSPKSSYSFKKEGEAGVEKVVIQD